jgi:uroporphyrinogen decarboxylase
MTSRERVRCTLNHTEPDKVPIDFGGTDVTCIHVSPYSLLKDKLGLDSGPSKVFDTFQIVL